MKKLLILIGIFLLFGCTNSNINTLTLEEIIENQIAESNDMSNTNNKGYKYYLPTEFSVKKDNAMYKLLNVCFLIYSNKFE